MGLGLPKSQILDVSVTPELGTKSRLADLQIFDNGIIFRTPDNPQPFAALNGLLVDPTKRGRSVNYELKILEVEVLEESGPNGVLIFNNKDRLRSVFSYEYYDGETEQSSLEFYTKEVDNQKTYAIDRVLYQGGLPAFGVLSILGMEEDNEADANKVVREFERMVREESLTDSLFKPSDVSPDIDFPIDIYYGAMVVGAALGAIAMATATVQYTVTIGTVAGSALASKTFTSSGAVAGGAYGAAIAAIVAAVVNVVVIGVANWEPPDPLMVSGHGLFGPELLLAARDGAVPPKREAAFDTFGDYRVRVESQLERVSDQELIQVVDYDVDDGWARYRLRLRHTLGA